MTPQEEFTACIMHPELMKAWYELNQNKNEFVHALLDLEKPMIEVWVHGYMDEFWLNDRWGADTEDKNNPNGMRLVLFTEVDGILLMTYDSHGKILGFTRKMHMDETKRALKRLTKFEEFSNR